MGIPCEICITGVVYIKYLDEIDACKKGDILLYLNDDAISLNQGDYHDISSSGYIKALIYDGMIWQNIDISEFCVNRENKFTKKQYAIDHAYLCKEILEGCADVMVFKGYRGHFSRNKYEQSDYIRKSNLKNKKYVNRIKNSKKSEF